MLFLGSGFIFKKKKKKPYPLFQKKKNFNYFFFIKRKNNINNNKKNIKKKSLTNIFNAVATLGFAIDEMPEAVTVMLFYVVGELFQDIAVNRSRKSIKTLLEIKPDYANLKSNGDVKRVSPESVKVGENIIVKLEKNSFGWRNN